MDKNQVAALLAGAGGHVSGEEMSRALGVTRAAVWKEMEALRREGADRLVLLGDLLYHGPRHDFPEEYDTRAVTALLNGVKDQLLCVRGNCDSEVDQMVLEFPMLAEYAFLAADGLKI